MKEIRVLLVDDHQLITDGLKSLLEDVKGIRVVGSATNGKEALELLKILEIHLVLMDVDMPVMNGLDAAKVMKVTHGSIKVIILSMHGEQSLVRELVGMGVDGYLLKNTTKDELVSAIQKVHAGARYFSSDVTLSLINKKEDVQQSGKNTIELTNREIEILKLIAEGFTNKEIGEKLFISHRTVDSHRTNLMRKIEVNNVAGLINYAIKRGLLK